MQTHSRKKHYILYITQKVLSSQYAVSIGVCPLGLVRCSSICSLEEGKYEERKKLELCGPMAPLVIAPAEGLGIPFVLHMKSFLQNTFYFLPCPS